MFYEICCYCCYLQKAMHQAQEGGCSPRDNDTTGAVIVRVIIELSMLGEIGGTWDQCLLQHTVRRHIIRSRKVSGPRIWVLKPPKEDIIETKHRLSFYNNGDNNDNNKNNNNNNIIITITKTTTTMMMMMMIIMMITIIIIMII